MAPERNPVTTATARRLRRNQTNAEKLLWSRLRARQLNGVKFRRQFPLPPFVADFCCEAARLVVEVDGGQHAEAGKSEQARTESIEGRGYRVIRFWNSDVLSNIDGVLEEISKWTVSPSP